MKGILIAAVVAMAALGSARADSHYFSLSKIFPKGKCAGIFPNFELLKAGFPGGEITEYKIRDNTGNVMETLTTLINKQRDQWVTVVSKRDTKVIFCLFASGVGKGSVDRKALK